MRNEYRLVVVSGPSGSGKDTVVSQLIRRRQDIRLSVSCTTRKPRPKEKEGIDYYFLNEQQFEQRIADGDMLEYTRYDGNYYGTPMHEIEQKLSDDTTVVLIIEVTGAKNVKNVCPDSLCIFIVPPSLETLEQRLRARSTESEQEISRRLEIAARELQELKFYDYAIKNETAAECSSKLESIIEEWQEMYKDIQHSWKTIEKDEDEIYD